MLFPGQGLKSIFMSVTMADLLRAAKIATLTPLVWALPASCFSPLARLLGPIMYRGAVDRDRRTATVASVLSLGRVAHPAKVVKAWRRRLIEAWMQVLALNRPGRHWRPTIRWDGRENLDAALARGSGVILWVSDFVYSSLVTKMAFDEAGFPVTHLSRPGHGFSYTPFGIRFLNRFWTKVEDRFLRERVLITNETRKKTLELLGQRLAINGVISITVGNLAQRTLQVRFFGGTIRVATGPIHLARLTGASLLPIFTLRADDGVYHVSIGAPLNVESGSDYSSPLQSYSQMLESYVLRHPDQWNGWGDLIAQPSS